MGQSKTVQQKIANRLHAFTPLRRLMYRVYFFWCKKRIPPSSTSVLFESSGGMAYAGDPKAIYEAMQENPEYAAFDLKWAFCTGEKDKHKGLKKRPNTWIVERERRNYFRQLARAKYWITDGDLPSYLRPGKEQVWVLTSQSRYFEQAGALGPSVQRENRHIARRVTHFLSDSPYATQRTMEAFGLDGLGLTDKIVEAASPQNRFLYTYQPEDVFRVKMDYGVPLEKKVILVEMEYSSDLLESIQTLHTGACALFCRDGWLASAVKKSADGVQTVNVSKNSDINRLYIASDVLVTDSVEAVLKYANLSRPVVFYDGGPPAASPGTAGAISRQALPCPVETDASCLLDRAMGYLEHPERFNRERNRSFIQKYSIREGGLSTLRHLVDPNAPITDQEFCKKNRGEARRNLYFKGTGFFRLAGFNFTPNTRRMRQYKNAHRGGRCFLIGNGPSLTCEDLEMLAGEVTFGCNLIYKCFTYTDWRPTYYFVVDNMYGKLNSEAINKELPMPVFTTRTAAKNFKTVPDNFLWGYPYRKDTYKPYGNPLYLVNVKHSSVMVMMIEMAMYMGFSEIYLLGVDASNSLQSPDASYFVDGYSNQDSKHLLQKRGKSMIAGKQMSLEELGAYTVAKTMAAYETLETFSQTRDVKIYNATRGGYLEAFQRKSLEEALGEAARAAQTDG